MSTARFRRAEEIYFEVVELPRSERARVILNACAGDETLRTEVESLLAHSDAGSRFLATPAIGADLVASIANDSPATDELLGSSVGPYRIERRIASGGMGTVYLASRADAQFTQQVAVKVVKRGMDSEELVRRFRRERQTLAALNHPNIARLFDGGVTQDGRPYLVMEYVDGVPLDRYCEQHPLGTEARLRLFLRICDAVSYAHRNLVVHRDIKPTNILIATDGVPKLLDFGIATVLEAGGTRDVTSANEQRLTPEYASPEQVEGGPVTTSTDVYSLGIVLFELLTGSRPYSFTVRTAPEIHRVVCSQSPPAPSAAVGRTGRRAQPESDGETRLSLPANVAPDRLQRILKGDIDNIVLMAIRKEPERRYSSVEQFGDDIRRYLENRPVLARKDTFVYRASKFVRRNALACTIATAAGLSLMGGIAGVVWQKQIADRERDDAYLARDQSEAIYTFLQKMLSEADPGRAGPNATLRDWVDATAAGLEGQLKDQPLVRAAMQAAVGRMYISLGLNEKAEAELIPALEARTRLLPPSHHDVAESRDDLATLRYAQDRLGEAEELLRAALATFERIRSGDNPDHAEVLNDLGAVLRAAGRLDEAEETHRKAIAIRTRLFGAASIEAAESYNNLAGVLRSRAQKEESAARAAAEPDRPGHESRRMEFLTQAQKYATLALEARVAVLKQNHPLVAQSLQNLAVMKAEAGNMDDALRLMQESVASFEGIFSEAHPATIRALGSVSFIYRRKAMLQEAEPPLRRAIVLAERRLLPTDPLSLSLQLQLGNLYVAQNKTADAQIVFQRIVTTAEGDPRLDQVSNDARAALRSLADNAASEGKPETK